MEQETNYKLIKTEKSATLIFSKTLTIYNLDIYDKLKPYDKTFQNIKDLHLDFSNLEQFDTAFAVLCSELIMWAKRNQIEVVFEGLKENMRNFLEKFSDVALFEKKDIPKGNPFIWYFTYIGERFIDIFKEVIHFVEFFGELVIKTLSSAFSRKVRWTDFPSLFLKNGVNAVPIVWTILLLIGIISGYQGALQLKQFGADIFIADLIGVSLTRELGPLMTAIIVAGRSGSAFAAEIGTMKVSEEIDALRSMGFDPIYFLVIPRVLAVTFSIPFLVLFGNLAGILGGLISGLATLDITTVGYFTQLRIAVDLGDLMSGILKSLIFGYLVASIGCFRGLQVRGGAESVGTYTTISVVSGIFAIIIADALFTFIFDAIGL
ncbi:MAG: ABC transporter permease [Ignavibacteria bacterium]|nr:ABC transporter permease [Ignavibacteria bacterium]